LISKELAGNQLTIKNYQLPISNFICLIFGEKVVKSISDTGNRHIINNLSSFNSSII